MPIRHCTLLAGVPDRRCFQSFLDGFLFIFGVALQLWLGFFNLPQRLISYNLGQFGVGDVPLQELAEKLHHIGRHVFPILRCFLCTSYPENLKVGQHGVQLPGLIQDHLLLLRSCCQHLQICTIRPRFNFKVFNEKILSGWFTQNLCKLALCSESNSQMTGTYPTCIAIAPKFVFLFCAAKSIFCFLCTVSGCDGGNRTRNIAVYTWRFSSN